MERIPFFYKGEQVAYIDFDPNNPTSGDMTSTVKGYTWIGRVWVDTDSKPFRFRISNSRTGRMVSFWAEDRKMVFAKNYYDIVSQEEFLIYIGVFDV